MGARLDGHAAVDAVSILSSDETIGDPGLHLRQGFMIFVAQTIEFIAEGVIIRMDISILARPEGQTQSYPILFL